eukprot:5032303-Prymnesium_polylepis.1
MQLPQRKHAAVTSSIAVYATRLPHSDPDSGCRVCNDAECDTADAPRHGPKGLEPASRGSRRRQRTWRASAPSRGRLGLGLGGVRGARVLHREARLDGAAAASVLEPHGGLVWLGRAAGGSREQ